MKGDIDMAKKVLIVYGTRYGATEGTAEEIAKVLRDQGLEAKVANLKNDKVKDISEYDLVVVGTGMQMGKWTGSAEDFLKRFQKELTSKKVAIFVSSAAEALLEHTKNDEQIKQNRKTYLDDKVTKYNLSPVSTAMFGGVWDFNKMNFIFRRTLSSYKPKIEEAGFKEISPGLYDTRNWEEIKAWAKEVAGKV
jgi:menaquinone-dependent protoporphyrinogen oxidase